MPETALYVNATRAARLIGVNERTIRSWINQGKLSAHQPAPNRLEIPMSEINRIVSERQAQQALDQIPSPREMAALLASLQEEISAIQPGAGSPDLTAITSRMNEFDARLQRLEQQIVSAPPTRISSAATRSVSTRPARPMPERYAFEPLPPGAILARDFAIQYGVHPRTFLDHIVKGKNGELAPAESRPKPGRPDEMERYILPEQREDVLDYWRRQGVFFSLPQASESEEN